MAECLLTSLGFPIKLCMRKKEKEKKKKEKRKTSLLPAKPKEYPCAASLIRSSSSILIVGQGSLMKLFIGIDACLLFAA